MSSNTIKLIAIAAVFGFAIAFAAYRPGPVGAAVVAGDPAGMFKDQKCIMCHTATAAKFFDPKKADAELVDAIIKGKKGEKPPNMPAFDGKITPEQAQEMVTYMKGLRTAAGN